MMKPYARTQNQNNNSFKFSFDTYILKDKLKDLINRSNKHDYKQKVLPNAYNVK